MDVDFPDLLGVELHQLLVFLGPVGHTGFPGLLQVGRVGNSQGHDATELALGVGVVQGHGEVHLIGGGLRLELIGCKCAEVLYGHVRDHPDPLIKLP